MRKLALLAVLGCIVAFPAMADTRPSFLSEWISAEAPLGHATFRKLFMRVYDANLWTDADSFNYDSVFALSLTYNVSMESREFVDRTIKEMAHVAGMKKEDLYYYWPQLLRVFPDMKSGDTLTGLYVPGEPVRFFLNSNKTGEIADKYFPERFFGIWFSPNTSEPDFRQALIGAMDAPS